jgi:hypothetical protein
VSWRCLQDNLSSGVTVRTFSGHVLLPINIWRLVQAVQDEKSKMATNRPYPR